MGDRERWPDRPDPHPDRRDPGQGQQGGNDGGPQGWPDRHKGDEAEEFGPHGPGGDPDD